MGLCILYHKTCYKKLTSYLYKSLFAALFSEETLSLVKHWRSCSQDLLSYSYLSSKQITHFENEVSAIFDRSFHTLDFEIETNVLKGLKVVSMLELWSRFRQLSEEGIEASNYKSWYLQAII
jgi:hypothetical protein